MIRDAWDSVMNAEYNPLRNLPKTYKFQVMTYLSVMWCIIFSLWTGGAESEIRTRIHESTRQQIARLFRQFAVAELPKTGAHIQCLRMMH